MISFNARVSSWLSHYSIFYAFLVVISGGAHASLHLVNSRLFGKIQFDMGLYPSELIKFNFVRLWLVVLLEVNTFFFCF